MQHGGSARSTTTRQKLQRVQVLRRLLDADQELACPVTSTGLRRVQDKLAKEAAAARGRNSALLDALQQAADAGGGGGPAASEVAAADVQLMALQGAYLTCVRRGFDARLHLQRRHDRLMRQQQQPSTRAARAAAAAAAPRFAFTVPAPGAHHHHPRAVDQQQVEVQQVVQQAAQATLASRQQPLQHDSQPKQQAAPTSAPTLPPPAAAAAAAADAFMASLQSVTHQLALLQCELQRQQQQQQQQHAGSTAQATQATQEAPQPERQTQQQHEQQQVLAPAAAPPAEEAAAPAAGDSVTVAAADAACRVLKLAAKPVAVAVASGAKEQEEEPEQCLAGAGSMSVLSNSEPAGWLEDAPAPQGMPATQEPPSQQRSSHEGVRPEHSRCDDSKAASPATQLECRAQDGALAAPCSAVPLQHAQTQSLQAVAVSVEPSEADGSTASDVPQQAQHSCLLEQPAPAGTHARQQQQQQQPSGPPKGAHGALHTLVFSPLRLGSALASPAGATPSPGSSSLQQQAFSPLRLGSAALLQVRSGALSTAGADVGGAAAAAAAAGTEASGFVRLLTEFPEQWQPDGDQQQQADKASRRLSWQQQRPQPSRESSVAQADDDGQDAAQPGIAGGPRPQLDLHRLQQRQQAAFSPLRHGPVGLVGSASAASSPAAMSAAEPLSSSDAVAARAASQQPGISSLAAGLSMPAGPQAGAAAVVARGSSERRRSSDSGGTRRACTDDAAAYGDTAPTVLPGPLHLSMGGCASAAAADQCQGTAAGPLHMGLLLSPATRLSLGGASTADDGAWSSGRPSLAGSDAAPSTAAGAAPVAERALAAAAGRAPGVLLASWGSSVASGVAAVSGGLRVPRLSLPPTLLVPDAPVPNSARSAASTPRSSTAGVARQGMSVAQQHAGQQQHGGGTDGSGSVARPGLTQPPHQAAAAGWPAAAIGRRHTGDAVAAAAAPASVRFDAGALSDSSSDAAGDAESSDEFSFGEPSPPLQPRQRPRQPDAAASSWLVSRVANAASGLTEFGDD